MSKVYLWKLLVELFLEKEIFQDENLGNSRNLPCIQYLQFWKLRRLLDNEKIMLLDPRTTHLII
jgi:hypothetical protein